MRPSPAESESGSSESHQPAVKIIVIGESGVGKTSLLQRFSRGSFDGSECATIGVDFVSHKLCVDGRTLQLQIWDTAGQERFHAVTRSFYRGVLGVILVYDVTSASTLEKLKCYWLEDLSYYLGNATPVKVLVGNKVDLEDARQVRWADGMRFSKACDALFVETSAKSGVAVQNVFEELALTILHTPVLAAALNSTPPDASLVQMRAEQRPIDSTSCAC